MYVYILLKQFVTATRLQIQFVASLDTSTCYKTFQFFDGRVEFYGTCLENRKHKITRRQLGNLEENLSPAFFKLSFQTIKKQLRGQDEDIVFSAHSNFSHSYEEHPKVKVKRNCEIFKSGLCIIHFIVVDNLL